ncbi:MAG: DUF2892 domain-containing protein [Acidobacteriota bacterium]|jgi:hypothetical protein|nr:DUF2892 domain-containing protein [Acidobacteriota bacterium]
MTAAHRFSAVRILRIALSLAVIGYGLWTRNWVGLLGLVTLFSAFSGTCPLIVRFPSRD